MGTQILPLLKDSSKYQVKAVFRCQRLQTLTFASLYLQRRKSSQRTEVPITPQTSWSENLVAKQLFFQLWTQEQKGIQGQGFFLPKITFVRVSQNCCYSSLLAYISVNPWSGVGWAPWLILPALVCLGSVLGTACCSSRGGLGHSLDEDRLLEAVSTGDTSHKATYALFYLLIAIQANKKKKIKGALGCRIGLNLSLPKQKTPQRAFSWFFIISSAKSRQEKLTTCLQYDSETPNSTYLHMPRLKKSVILVCE